MADDVAQFLSKTSKMTAELDKLPRSMVLIASQAVKTSVLAQMQAAGVDNGRLRGVGKKGAKVGVRYDLTGHTTAVVRATGPFHLIERDTQPHRIPRERKTTRARKRIVVIPGVGPRAYAQHPGTKGKHPWAKGVVAALPVQERAQGLALQQAMRRSFK